MDNRTSNLDRPQPLVLRSRRQLMQRGVTFVPPGAVAPARLPIQEDGTTYSMAQEAAWLDAAHFAVGRWDGSLSIFNFNPSRTNGPVITQAVSSPAAEGIQMIVWLAPGVFVTSNDDASLVVWRSASRTWQDLQAPQPLLFDKTLGVANSGDSFAVGDALFLVVGHANGYLSIWRGAPDASDLTLLKTVDVRSQHPVNPWGLHNVRGVCALLSTDARGYIVSGSEDGNLCVVSVPDGQIVSTTVYNPTAERGINSVAVLGQNILVANCSVGPSDKNLWYYTVDFESFRITLRDSTNLKVNPSAPQVFNFCTIWALYDGGVCFFTSTEEGALWMGTVADQRLAVIGYQEVSSALGAALAFNVKGQLVMVNHNLYEFVTRSAPAVATEPANENPERIPTAATSLSPVNVEFCAPP